MNMKDFFAEYKQLIEQTTKAQHKVSSTLDKALSALETERRTYEDFNQKHWLLKYKSLFIILAPLLMVLLLIAGGYLFVSTGHTIDLKIGDLHIIAK